MREYLHVDMAAGTCRRRPLPDELAAFGGRALASCLASRHPGSLCFAPGLLTGCRASSVGRCSVSCSMPDGAVLHSNAGGSFGTAMMSAGLAAIAVTGPCSLGPGQASVLVVGEDSARLETFGAPCVSVPAEMEALSSAWPEAAALAAVGPAAACGLPMASLEFSNHRLKPSSHAGSGSGSRLFSMGIRGVVILKSRRISPVSEEQEEAVHRFMAGLKARSGDSPVGEGGCTSNCVLACHRQDGAGSSHKKAGKSRWPGHAEYWSSGDSVADAADIARFSAICDDLGADAFVLARLMMQAADRGVLPRGDAASALRELEKLGAGAEDSVLYASAMACPAEKHGREEDVQDIVMDCLGICRFAAEAMAQDAGVRGAVWDMVRCLYGLDAQDLEILAGKVLALESGRVYP